MHLCHSKRACKNTHTHSPARTCTYLPREKAGAQSVLLKESYVCLRVNFILDAFIRGIYFLIRLQYLIFNHHLVVSWISIKFPFETGSSDSDLHQLLHRISCHFVLFPCNFSNVIKSDSDEEYPVRIAKRIAYANV